MRKILLIELFCLFIMSNAQAMTCERPKLKSLIDQSDYIFTGKVSKRKKVKVNSNKKSWCWDDRGGSCGPKIATFEILDTYKGDLEEQVDVFSIDGCYCLGTYFIQDQYYLVFANENNEHDYLDDIGSCTTENLGWAIFDGVLQELNKKTRNSARYIDEKVLGTWENFGHENDLNFENISKVNFKFKKKYKLRITLTFEDGTEESTKGLHFEIDNILAIGTEEEDLDFEYRFDGEFLLLESLDKKYRYKLKRI